MTARDEEFALESVYASWLTRKGEGTVRLEGFIRESNRIEGLHHDPTEGEINAHAAFLALRTVTVADMELFVARVQPDAALRRRKGQNVWVGNHRPPPGGPGIEPALSELLEDVDRSCHYVYDIHCQYESLHPFTDGNGRSGRVLWLWMMGGIEAVPLGFLHTFYYQVLDNRRTGG